MGSPWTVGVVTTSRADYGIYASVLNALDASPNFKVTIYVGGSHLSDDFGMTINGIRDDGYDIAAQVPSLPNGDSETDIAVTMGEATSGFAKAFAASRPDVILVLGDRYEMHSAAVAALPMRIPVGHIHGGEETEGAMDNSLRHSMSKLSHVHFCSTPLAEKRLLAMGEIPNAVHRTGAPALDSILSIPLMSREDWGKRFNVPDGPFALLTYHPVTLAPERTIEDFDMVFRAARSTGLHCVISLSNADTGGMGLNAHLNALAQTDDRVSLQNSMGARGYYSAMKHAELMIGNSSSGIIEAASLGLPVVNIGERQTGRETSPNTITTATEETEILKAINTARSDAFRAICTAKVNVYGDGSAADKITDNLRGFMQSGASVIKRFHLS